MKFEIITKTLVTKFYTAEAENEKEAIDLIENPDTIHEDYEEVVSVTEVETKLDVPEKSV
jgi:hypothetical protein